MKKTAFILLIFSLLVSCSYSPDQYKENKGELSFQFDYQFTPETERNTLYPVLENPESLKLILTAESGEVIEVILEDGESTAVLLDPGFWNLDATGFRKGNPVYKGNCEFRIEENRQTTVNLLLSPQQAAKGRALIHYTLNKNENIPWPKEDVVFNARLVNKDTGEGPGMTLTREGNELYCQSGDVQSGFYVLILRASGADSGRHFPDISRTSAIYIYDYLNTEFEEIITPSPLHAPPGNSPFLNPEVINSGEIRLHWGIPAGNNIVYWEIERSENSSGYSALAEKLPANSSEYIDMSVQSGKKYQYRIRGKNPYNEVSDWIETGIVEL